MKISSKSLCNNCFLLLAIPILPILLIMLSSDVNRLVKNKAYVHLKYDKLTYNSTTSSYTTKAQGPNLGAQNTYSSIDDLTFTNNLTISSVKLESTTHTSDRRIEQAYLNLDIVTNNSNISTKYVGFSKPIKKRRLPQAIIIGAMKCGTRALTSMMEMHSKFVSPEKEKKFFGMEYDRGLEWYREQMPYSYEDQITLEKSPSYFKINNLTIPQRINLMNSSIRLILIVRDPVVRSISHYVHIVKNQNGSMMDFEDLALGSDRKVNQTNPILFDGLYEKAFKLYLEVFSPEQILVVDGEQLINNPFPIIKKVEKFLNLPREIQKSNFYFHKKKGFYCMKQNGNKECLEPLFGRSNTRS